jgi:hypothetical protein
MTAGRDQQEQREAEACEEGPHRQLQRFWVQVRPPLQVLPGQQAWPAPPQVVQVSFWPQVKGVAQKLPSAPLQQR